MALAPQKFREIVFQLLYSHDFEDGDEAMMCALLMRQNKIPKKEVMKCTEMSKKVWQLKADIDLLIQKSSLEYELDRIPKAERNILRLGIYELLHTDLPNKVAIVEAMRLARKYATPETANFINAVLDGIYKESISQPQEAQ